MRVGLIGAGNMAAAMARGWGDPVYLTDSGSGRAQALVDELGGTRFDSNRELAESVDVVVLCHKPYQLEAVAREIAGVAKAVVSVLGGVALSRLDSVYSGIPVYAFMPNTPVEVRRGVLVLAVADAGRERSAPDQATDQAVIDHFGRLGSVIRVPEKLFDAVTSVSGVGPAYFALLAEAQADAAVRHGIPAPLANRLVAETMAGTAALLQAHEYDTLAVRRQVTSPGGSTARGLAALERGGVRHAFQAAADAVATPPEKRV
jgi:pyrroline-5-carboxylate reductase